MSDETPQLITKSHDEWQAEYAAEVKDAVYRLNRSIEKASRCGLRIDVNGTMRDAIDGSTYPHVSVQVFKRL